MHGLMLGQKFGLLVDSDAAAVAHFAKLRIVVFHVEILER